MPTRIPIFLLIACMAMALPARSQWTRTELAKANTAAAVPYLTDEEKAVVQYVNLARMYPQKFLEREVQPYERPEGYAGLDRQSDWYRSLVAELTTMRPLEPLQFDSYMYKLAAAWAGEMNRRGVTGHKRTESTGYYAAECCQYGFAAGRDIVIDLLIDEGVQNLGHRKNLFNAEITTIGVAIRPHSQWKVCTVIDSDYPRMRQYNQTRSRSVPPISKTIVWPVVR